MTGSSQLQSMGTTARASSTQSGSAAMSQSIGDTSASFAPEVPGEDALGLGLAAVAGYLFSYFGSPIIGGVGLAIAAAVAFLL